MEYQKLMNLFNNTVNSIHKFTIKSLVETNDDVNEVYKQSQIWFKTKTTKWSLCDCSDVYILAKGTISITTEGTNATAKEADEMNKHVTFKNFGHFRILWVKKITRKGMMWWCQYII